MELVVNYFSLITELSHLIYARYKNAPIRNET